MKRWILPPLLSVAATLLLLEGAARLLTDHGEGAFADPNDQLTGFFVPDADTFWALRPRFYSDAPQMMPKWGGVPLVLNEHGMRSPPVPLRKPPGIKRAIVIGGSHPMGMWVRAGEAYSAVLERRINQGDGPIWSVINASVAGYTSWQGLRQLETRLLALEPDLILCDLGVNDTLPQLAWNVPRPDHRLGEPPAVIGGLRALLRRSAAYRWALSGISRGAEAVERGPRVSDERHRANLRRIQEVAATVGARTLYLNQFQATVPPWDEESTEASCVYDEADLEPVVDVCGLFMPRFEQLPDLFVDPIHANAKGHAMIADLIHERLVGLGWLD